MRHCTMMMVLFALVIGVSLDAMSRVYYVSPSGNDGNAGTLANPWRTISKAGAGLQAGDTVLVRAGVYHERVQISNSGTLVAPIVYRAYPGEKPEMKKIRFRTLGCYPLTGGVESDADTLEKIIEETLGAVYSERTSRVIDHEEAGSMERRKREGYF